MEPTAASSAVTPAYATFLAEADRLDLDIVILDVMMPSMSGLQAAREIRRRVPGARLIFLTASEDRTWLPPHSVLARQRLS